MVGFGKDNPIARKHKSSKNGPMLLESAVIAHKAGDIVKAESPYLSAIDSGFHHEIAFSNLGGFTNKQTGQNKPFQYINKQFQLTHNLLKLI